MDNIEFLIVPDESLESHIKVKTPSVADILKQIDKMKPSTSIELFLSEEKCESLHIAFMGDGVYTCIHGGKEFALYLTEDKISQDESFLSYDEFAPARDIRVSKEAVKGAVVRFNQYNGINECVEWVQDFKEFE